MSGVNISCKILSGGQSSKLVLSGANVQSAALTSTSYVVTADTDCFVRTGANPIAVADGTDQFLLGGSAYRVTPLMIGDKLSFITSGAGGNVYLTPDA